MSATPASIQKLGDIGSTLLQPFTSAIIDVLTDLQKRVITLEQTIEQLQSGDTIYVINDKNKSSSSSSKLASSTNKTTSIKIPKTDIKASKSAPTTPVSAPKSRKKDRSELRTASRNRYKRNRKPEPEPEPEPQAEEKQPENIDDIPSEDQILDTSNLGKERGAKRPLRWSFQNDHNIIKQSNNGAGAVKPKFKPGTIRFGKYISKADGDYASYQFKFDTGGLGPTASGYAFGVVTKGFNDYTQSNFGQNGSVMIKGNGQYVTTDGMFTSENKEYIHKAIIPEFRDGGLCGEGDRVCMEIDLEELTLEIWNDTRNDGKRFKVTIPNKPISAMVYLSGSAKRKILISEQCAFKYKE